jgi:putative oxidoreductase
MRPASASNNWPPEADRFIIHALAELPMTTFEKTSELAGRILIASLFLIAGLGKIGAYAATQGYMASKGVPGAVLPVVIAFELLGAIAIILGYRTRLVAAALAGFSIVAGFVFHGGADQIQQVLLLKNIAIAGGFLLLVARGAGDWSLDARAAARTAPGELPRGT